MTGERDPLELARLALAGQRAWLVGGAVRDRVRGGSAADLDIVLDGDPAAAARALVRAASAPRASAFALSEEYGGWRVVAHGGAWQIDLERLRGDSLEADLALRDFTVNAIAEPLGRQSSMPGELIDPLGGLEDLEHRRLRAAGPRAFAEDPLRVLRLVRDGRRAGPRAHSRDSARGRRPRRGAARRLARAGLHGAASNHRRCRARYLGSS